MSKRRALVVLGMHRSGTSALARVLSLRGAELPEHVLAANRGNQSGYWEPAPIVQFNDELLDYFGLDWDDPFAESQLPAAGEYPKKFHTRAQKLLDQEFGEADLFVLKDPRVTLLHGFWFDQLAQRKIKPSPVVVMRPYAQVADSLLRRDQSNPEASVLLYVAYGLAAAAAVHKRGASFLTYDQLVHDWKASSDRIAAEQGFKWPRTSAFSGQEVAQFLESAPAKPRALHVSPVLQGWADAVWDWFRTQAEGGAVDPAALDPVRQQLADAAQTFSPVVAERRRRGRVLTDERAQVGQAAQASHQQYEQAQADHARTAAERDQLIAERDRLLALYESTHAELVRAQAAWQDARGALERTEAAAAQSPALAAQRDTLQAERDRVLALYEATHAELAKVQGAYRTIELDAVRADERLAAQDAQHAQARATIERLDAERRAVAGQREAMQSERDRVLALFDAAQAELARTQAAFRDADAALAQASTRAGLLEGQVASLQATHAALEADHRALTAQRDSLQGERDKLLPLYEATHAELARTQDAHRDVAERLADTGGRLAQVEAALAAAHAEHHELGDHFQALFGERDALQEERDRLLALYDAGTTELQRTQQLYAELDARAAQVERERDEARGAHAAVVAALEQVHAALADQQADTEKHAAVGGALAAELDRTQDAWRIAQAAVEQRDERIVALEARQAEDIAALEAQLRDRLAELSAAHDAQLRDQLAQLAAAHDARIAALQAGWRAEREQAAGRHAEREAAHTAQVAGLRGELAKLAQERDASRARAAQLEAALLASNANATRLDEQGKQLESYLIEAERRHEVYEAEITRMNGERQSMQTEQYRLLEAQQRIDEDLELTRRQLTEQDAALAALRRQHDTETHALNSQLDQTRHDAEAERQRHRTELQARVAAWEEKLVAAQAQLHEARVAARAEQNAAKAVHAGLGAEIEALRGRVGLQEIEHDELAAQLRLVIDERDQLQSHLQQLLAERERVRAWSEQLGAELSDSHGQIAKLGQERDELQARLWTVLDEQRRVGDELEDVRAQREYLADDLQDTRASLRRTAASLEEIGSVRAELQALGDRLQVELYERHMQLEQAQEALQEIYASRSWRITEPLRKVTIAGRRVISASSQLIHRPRRLLSLPAPTTPSPPVPASAAPSGGDAPRESSVVGVPAQATPATTAQLLALAEPEYARRRHPGLRSFLVAEFGDTAAAAALLRIDRFRLPIDTAEVRGTAKAACTDDEARYWAASLARRAERRHLGGDTPDVSIVIPVYNQVPFTLACIDSLLAQQSRYTFEILVGDDASTDATAVAFALPIDGLTHVRHPQNLGFVRNCNATAAHARGRYVVMLNNDTQVLPGWLDELIDVLEGDANVGLAGSKLIYPDGRMQECGGIVWKDGSAWNFGRLDDPRKPEYCYLRGVDYVSGASIALPMALWRQLGGFDEHYVPAYAEDVDLAFRVRAAGLATVVQPLSQLLHFEGVSSGTDLGAGAKAYQVENLRKLQVRWAGVLAGHRDNADRPDLEKERGIARRVLFVDHTTLTPNEDAGSLVAFEILQSLRKCGYKVTFVPEDNFAHVGADTRALQRMGIETIYHPAYSRMEQFLAARHDPFDLVVMHRFSVGDQHLAALKGNWPDAKFVFLACDLHHLREMREAELSGEPGAMARALDTRDRELAVARSADAIMVYSEAERDLLAAELPGANVVLFPLVHDPIAAHVDLAARDGVCFVGGYRHPPNADGIAWFAEHAWPIVRSRCPDHVLYVVGSHMTDAVRALGDRKGVEIVGFVDDMEAFLAQRRVNVAPLRYGAGVKGKVSAALANGVPTVCTPIAAEGMQLSPGVDILIGHDPTELAEQVIAMLGDDLRWQQVSDAGLAYAARVTSRASAHRRIRAMLGSIGLAPSDGGMA